MTEPGELMSTDLRERLENALEPHTGTDGPGVGIPAEAALAVFAAWLHERAKAMEDERGDMHVAADLLDDWADEISPAPRCDHTTRIELSVPGDSQRTWQCTACGGWIRTPWAS